MDLLWTKTLCPQLRGCFNSGSPSREVPPYLRGNCKVPIYRLNKACMGLYHINDTSLSALCLAALLSIHPPWNRIYKYSNILTAYKKLLQLKIYYCYHVKHISAKASRTLNFLRQYLFAIRSVVKATAHNCLVRPFEYASPIWYLRTKKDIDYLEAIQRHVARWVHGSRWNLHTLQYVV